MACVATWSFGLQAVCTAKALIEEGKTCVDVLEKAINVVEDDPSTGPYYVGRGCYPNRDGMAQLDAAIMRGADHSFGAVGALEGSVCAVGLVGTVVKEVVSDLENCARQRYKYPKAVSVARSVLEHPSLNMVVGSGAVKFAINQGFLMESNTDILSEMTMKAYEKYKSMKVKPPQTGHDTLSVVSLDKDGHLAAGVSTSGPPFKTPGRVGDSPLPGCGLYADDEAGAAAVSGDGECIMKFCPSFQIVQLMREGRSTQEACDQVIKAVLEQNGQWFEIAAIALDTKGTVGAASTVKEWTDFRTQENYSGFPYAHWSLHTGPPSINVKPAL